MRSFLVSVLVLTAAVLVVAAVVFRSGRARDTLRFLRNAAWLYIIGIVALAIWRMWTEF
jgi:uncharacterized membrane protein (UPF0182 family)